MTDLRRMNAFRDVQIAMDFQKMAENGYLDEEFTMYGCVYLDHGQRKYLISSEEIKIAEFIENSLEMGYWPSPLEKLTRVCHVPLGEHEEIANGVKTALAKKLQEMYPAEFLREFEAEYKEKGSDRAAVYLRQYVMGIVNCFSCEKVEMADNLRHLAYAGKVIDAKTNEELQKIIDKEKDKMKDDIIAKDLLFKTLNTVMYEKNGQIRYVTNARKEWAINKKNSLRNEGCIASPVYTVTYWHNNQQSLDEVQARHKEHYLRALDEDYFALVKQIYQCDCGISKTELAQMRERAAAKYGESVRKMLDFYESKWFLQ